MKKMFLVASLFMVACSKKTAPNPSITDSSAAAGQLSTASPDSASTQGSSMEAFTPGVVYFEFDSWTLTAEGRADLQKKAEILKTNTAQTIRLEGHTDERGSNEYNLALGDRRARAVMDYLAGLGIDADRFEIYSFGEEQLAVQGSSEDAHAKNRRVESTPVIR